MWKLDRTPSSLLCTFILSILSQGGCLHHSPWTLDPQGRLNDADIAESSGIAASLRFKDVLWTHNDGNNAPRLFAVDLQGKLIRNYIVPGATNHDWEDIAIDQDGNLYLLDNTSRTDPQQRSFVYIVREPDPFNDEKLAPAKKIAIRFPDSGYDCEAILVWNHTIYLITKPWDGTLPRIYSLADTEKGGTAKFLGYVRVHAMITGGDISPDGKRIALCSYRALLIFEGSGPPGSRLQTDPHVCRLNARQVEAIAWNKDELFLTNEQREIFRIPKSRWEQHAAPFLKSPKQSVPFTEVKPLADQSLRSWTEGRWLQVSARGRHTNIGRVSWSASGLHIGVNLPEGLELRTLAAPSSYDEEDWFQPGSVYLMINPGGTRPLVYGRDDRCIVLGRSPSGQLSAHVKYLRPATLVASSETMPEWLQFEQSGRQLLITLTPDTPGMGGFKEQKTVGFNLLFIRRSGEIVSWTPLAQRYSWDAPSFWGLLELKN